MNKVAVRGLLRVKRYPLSYTLWRRVRRSTNGVVSTPATDLCIEGFESSANSFTVNMVRYLSSGLRLAHHCHTVASVELAVRNQVPTIILFRNPSDAIPSLVARYRPRLYEAVHGYIQFYEHVRNLTDYVTLTTFEEATTRIDHTLRKISLMTGVGFNASIDAKRAEGEVRKRMQSWQRTNSIPHATPLPTRERDAQKERLRKLLLRMDEYEGARDIHKQMIDAYEQQEAGL